MEPCDEETAGPRIYIWPGKVVRWVCPYVLIKLGTMDGATAASATTSQFGEASHPTSHYVRTDSALQTAGAVVVGLRISECPIRD